jgi:hypothetical protein
MPSTSSPSVERLGVQRPRIHHAPPRATSAGLEAVDLAAHAGLELDEWQQFALVEALGETAGGKWAAFQVGLVVPRQNGKGSIIEARELAGLFLFGERLIIHTAHEFPTAQEHFLRILQLIESTPDFDRRVKKVSRSHGDEGIELKSGQRLRFKARTRGGGRGFSGDVVVLDEAFELPVAAHGALLPTLSARPNPQVWYASSAVNQMVHPHGLVLAGLRKRALAGDDPSLCYLEHSVDEDEYLAAPLEVAADPRYWAIANPGLGIRITTDYVAGEHRAMISTPETFATERLGVGDWPNPEGAGDDVMDMGAWATYADPHSEPLDPVAFGLDVNPERTHAAIGLGGRRADGRRHVEVVDHKAGTRWVVDRMSGLIGRWGPCAVVVHGNGPAASLIPELEAAGITVIDADGGLLDRLSTAQYAQACAGLYDKATSNELRHLGDPRLDNALRGAKKRERGETFTWARKPGADISPLVAVTLADYGHQVHGRDGEVDLTQAIH